MVSEGVLTLDGVRGYLLLQYKKKISTQRIGVWIRDGGVGISSQWVKLDAKLVHRPGLPQPRWETTHEAVDAFMRSWRGDRRRMNDAG